MIRLDPPFRAATPDDAAALTDLVHFASEGLALYVWTRIAGPAGDPWADRPRAGAPRNGQLLLSQRRGRRAARRAGRRRR